METPEGNAGEGGARECVECVGDGTVVKEDWWVGERREEEEGVWFVVAFEGREEIEEPIVVLRCRFVVSAEGGGGRWFGSV